MRLSDLRPMHRAGNAATAESPIQEPLTNKNAHLLLFKSPTRALSESATGAHGESPIQEYSFLSDPGVPGVRSMGPVLCHSLTERGFADLTDVTLTKAIEQ